jgi:hypothetical protein
VLPEAMALNQQPVASFFTSLFGFCESRNFKFPIKVLARKGSLEELEEGPSSTKSTDIDSNYSIIFEYKNIKKEIYKFSSHITSTYLSSTKIIPRELRVQSSLNTNTSAISGKWRRHPVQVTVPLALRWTEWAREPFQPGSATPRFFGYLRFFLLIILTVPMHVSISMHFMLCEQYTDLYRSWPGCTWKWPRHAVNFLDMRPGTARTPPEFSSEARRRYPRLLVVQESNKWKVVNLDCNPAAFRKYVFVSYTNKHFNTNTSQEGREKLETIAQVLALEAGCRAYWMDFQCRAPSDQSELLTVDVNRFCDVVRSAERVVVVLPDSTPEAVKVWGSRMWTLPEGLLAKGTDVFFRCLDSAETTCLSKVQMTVAVWEDKAKPGHDYQPTRLLAEHYTGTFSLGRLELFSIALAALEVRSARIAQSNHGPELAYALMGFLNRRIDPAPEPENLFQAIARLSLHNDSDRLIERLICLLPHHPPMDEEKSTSLDESYHHPFESIAQKDQYGTYLWDISPICNVVGVANGSAAVVLDGCRAVPIEWNKFPRIRVKTYNSHAGDRRKKLTSRFVEKYAKFMVRATSEGLLAVLYWIPWLIFGEFFQTLQTFFLLILAHGVAIILLPNIRSLFGGANVVTPPRLVAFEGTMPLAELETLILGFDNKRLSYEPSSTPIFCDYRHPTERMGIEPPWIADPLKYRPPALAPGHRLFTLVDTGTLTVFVFEAVNPPTVMLLCGIEGGMLRGALQLELAEELFDQGNSDEGELEDAG